MVAESGKPPFWRYRLALEPGTCVRHGDTAFVIKDVVDFKTVLAMPIGGGASKVLPISELAPEESVACVSDFADITEQDWRVARERYEAIKPLLEASRTRAAVELRVREVGYSVPTLFRWIKRYLDHPSIVSLVSGRRGWAQGRGRFQPQVEGVIQHVIQTYYLTPERRSAKKAIIEVQRRCRDAELPVPGASAIRERLCQIPEPERMRGQGQAKKARDKFQPVPGKFPGADFPLAVIQIDHTPVDLILVDDVHRLPVGRPTLTLAIDVFSRVVTGYYISFDPPSGIAVAMCVAHAVLPKDSWLLAHGVEADWPVWGLPKLVHVDNGADFRAYGFQESLEAYGIECNFRPVKNPKYGGHIERLLGTLMKEIHDLPGTTFSSVAERGDYDSEKRAVMTISEFEKWLVTMICKIYHQRPHRGIGMPPIKKWELGVFGADGVLGVGLPDVPADREHLLLDFLPSFERTIQASGVTFNGLRYYDECLRHWINVGTEEPGKKKRSFRFRWDPRDLSRVWFFDPTLKKYSQVPFADQSLPPMSIWEYRQVRRILKERGMSTVNETVLKQGVDDLRAQEEDSQERTKRARRQVQRRREQERKVKLAMPASRSDASVDVLVSATGLVDDEVEPFGEIE